jgi:hypothetical protein
MAKGKKLEWVRCGWRTWLDLMMVSFCDMCVIVRIVLVASMLQTFVET